MPSTSELESSSRAPPGTLRVCGGCGSIAPTRRRECQVCDAALDRYAHEIRPERGGELDDAYWVAIRSEFQCRACGKLSPINHLELEGEATCLHCATNQAFDVGQWREALSHAHAVGDLSGPDPEGRRAHALLSIARTNPMRELGVSETFSEHSQGGVSVEGAVTVTRSLRIRVSPGHPLDERGRPLALRRRPDARGDVILASSTGEQAEYALPHQAQQLAPGLCGVIAGDHRRDRLPVRVQLASSETPAALRCPSCGAPLDPPEGARIISCRYCSTTARIPERTLVQLGQRPRLELWWLAFRGPSSLRLRLEAGDAEIGKPPPQTELARLLAGSANKDEGAGSRFQVERPELDERFDPRRFVVGLVVPIVVLLAVGWLWFADAASRWW